MTSLSEDETALDCSGVDEPANETAGSESTSAAECVQRAGGRWITPLLAAASALALVFAVVSAAVWWHDGHNATRTAALTRDTVLKLARIDIATLNTMNSHEAVAGLQRWGGVTTGTLHVQIEHGMAAVAQTITSAKVSTSALILAAAVTGLDLNRGTATVIASVQLTKTPDAGASVVDRNRVKATMTRVGGTWRLSDLLPVSVELQ